MKSLISSASGTQPISVLISRRELLIGATASLCAAQLPLGNRAYAGASTSSVAEYQQDVLIRWGDPLWSKVTEVPITAMTAEDALVRFGYNNDFIAFLPLPLGSKSSTHGLLVANHEYPIPHLMFKDLSVTESPHKLSKTQIAATMEAVGMSVVEIRRDQAKWTTVQDSAYNRRISATTPMKISGPAAGHVKMQTKADPSGRVVFGTHDNCNGGISPWGTFLSGEEGSQDFFGGDIQGLPDQALLARYHYDQITAEGKFAWHRHDNRFNINHEPNEPNRFEWIVEVDPYEPDAPPVKRTALGRFAHEGAHCVLAPDGRVVIYMGDDWEFEYCYRFVSAQAFNPHNRAANKDLLDDGVLSVAYFADDGSVTWRSLIFGQGPLTPQNGFSDQGDVLIQTRRAADLLGATPMDCPEGYIPDPITGKVYIALSGNDERTKDKLNAANPRAKNASGHILELSPPDKDGTCDHSAERFSWCVKILCDEDPAKTYGFHPSTKPDGHFFAPDNINFDPQGTMWICSDGPNQQGQDGLWTMPTTGPDAWRSQLFFHSPLGSECCGPAFTPDGKSMFVAIQHPGGDSDSIKNALSRWPDFIDGEPPRPAVIAVTWK